MVTPPAPTVASEDQNQRVASKLSPIPTEFTKPSWTVASLCAGMCTEHWAGMTGWLAGLTFVLALWVEPESAARSFCVRNLPATAVNFLDVMSKEFINQAPPVDMVVAGFPCQPYSCAGMGGGLDDPRGVVVFYILRYVAKHLPRVVVMECVKGLVNNHAEAFVAILEAARGIIDPRTSARAYFVSWRILDSCEVGGVPHHRPRVYIVMILFLGRALLHFKWPEPIAKPSLGSLFDQDPKITSFADVEWPTAKTLSNNLRRAVIKVLELAQRENKDPLDYDAIVDTGGSRLGIGFEDCPCICHGRGSSLAIWNLNRWRPLTTMELLRYQGYNTAKLPFSCDGISRNQMGGLLGNSMTVTVVARVMRAAIDSATGASC